MLSSSAVKGENLGSSKAEENAEALTAS